MNQSLNIDELINKNLNVLNKNKLIYCATAHDGRIKSRIVDYYNEGLTIGFITWEDSIKVNHMKYNPAVSLCIENLQIEGKAKFAGHPSLEQNKDFMESYKKRHPVPYKNFIGMKDIINAIADPIITAPRAPLTPNPKATKAIPNISLAAKLITELHPSDMNFCNP